LTGIYASKELLSSQFNLTFYTPPDLQGRGVVPEGRNHQASAGHMVLSSWMLQYAASLSLVSWQSIIEREEETGTFSSPGILSTGPFKPPGHLPTGRMLLGSATSIFGCGKYFL
jgi:hypothetical protein